MKLTCQMRLCWRLNETQSGAHGFDRVQLVQVARVYLSVQYQVSFEDLFWVRIGLVRLDSDRETRLVVIDSRVGWLIDKCSTSFQLLSPEAKLNNNGPTKRRLVHHDGR